MKNLEFLREELEAIKNSGLLKTERVIDSPQAEKVVVSGKEILNFCANNYLGLANSEQLKTAARQGLDKYGLGMASVRFICGTQTIHKELERKISGFLGMDDTILYSSCFDANAGLFEALLDEGDAVISDELNHASIIDGIRLCKAKRFKYEHSDMDSLAKHLADAKQQGVNTILITTDGVFSMDGDIAKLDEICRLAAEYGALVMVDDSHATGFLGPTGRGSIEHCGVMGKVDIVNSTLGKALGGASGGFTAARKEIVDLLRQKSRPYLFSNSLPPTLVCASTACIDMLSKSSALRDKLAENTAYFRENMTKAGFQIRPGIHPIVPIMLGDAALATAMADDLLKEGVYVVGFSYPVVPKGKARIRVQVSAEHSRENLDTAIKAFTKVGRKHGVLPE